MKGDSKFKKPKMSLAERQQRRKEKVEKYQSRQAEQRVSEQASQALAESRRGTRNPKDAIRLMADLKPRSAENTFRQVSNVAKIPSSSRLRWVSLMFDAFSEDNNHYKKAEKQALREKLRDLLLCLEDKRIELEGRDMVQGITGLVKHHKDWIRQPEDWEVPSYNSRRQFASLARHLFAKYSIPTFMDSAWYTGNNDHQGWFKHIGIGNNIRTASNLPIEMTKKMAHHFLQAPNDYDIVGAIRWGQVHAFGGDERAAQAIVRTRIGMNDAFLNDDFWSSVIRWFIDNPMLDTVHYAPIADYLNNQKFMPTIQNPEQTGPRLVAAQPGLSMHHRDVEATLRQVEAWHRHTGREGRSGQKTWNPSGIPGFQYEEGKDERRMVYVINELLTARELAEEGRFMRHCVGSYSFSCGSGNISIWSMYSVDYFAAKRRLLTIEVNNKNKSISQARGKYNARPTGKDSTLMGKWAQQAKLGISRWLI